MGNEAVIPLSPQQLSEMNTMSKITILGLLIVIDQREDAGPQLPPSPSGGRPTPTLDELFAQYFQGDNEQTDIIFEEEYGPVFTR